MSLSDEVRKYCKVHYENQSVEVVGLVDSGSTVNVLPYQA